jgi:hypothetical protein
MGGERSAIVRHLSSNPQPIQRQSFSPKLVKAQQGCKLPPLPEKLPLGGGFFYMDCVPTQLSSSISLPDLPGEDTGREDHCNSIAGSGHALSARRMCRRLTSDDWRCSKAVRSYEKCQPKRPDQDPQEVEDAGAWSVIPLG